MKIMLYMKYTYMPLVQNLPKVLSYNLNRWLIHKDHNYIYIYRLPYLVYKVDRPVYC